MSGQPFDTDPKHEGAGPMSDIVTMVADERRDLAAFLETLTPEQWEAPSLCDGWSVLDTAAHLISLDQFGLGGVLAQRLLRRPAPTPTPAGVVQTIRDHLYPHGITAIQGGRMALIEGVMHHQDIRRALGAQREVPGERLAVVPPDLCVRRPCPAAATCVACVSSPMTSTGPTVKAPRSTGPARPC